MVGPYDILGRGIHQKLLYCSTKIFISNSVLAKNHNVGKCKKVLARENQTVSNNEIH